MYVIKMQKIIVLWGCFLVLMATMSSCRSSVESPETLYLKAVEDAKTVSEAKIDRDLTPITEDNKKLIQSETQVGQSVLVVTWTSWDGYDKIIGDTTELSRSVWVSVSPEMYQFCSSRSEDPNLSLRLEQLLGLKPASGKNRVVSFWVRPEDLFRPCPDSEIDDSQCELDFPDQVTEEYRVWFNGLKDTSYGTDGYPWTRLGYTYDWGNPKSSVGISEYVIKEGATVEVKSVMETSEYCQP